MTTKYLKSETPKMHVVNTTLLIPSYIYTCMKVYHKFEITHTKTINVYINERNYNGWAVIRD